MHPPQDRPPTLNRPPTRAVASGALLVLALFLAGAVLAGRSYVDLHRLVERELELRFLSGQLLYLREQLSASARLAAVTGDGQWEQRYRAVSAQFEAALRRTVAIAPPQPIAQSPVWLSGAALAAVEEQAFAARRDGRPAQALALLEGADYAARQRDYVDALQRLGTEAVEQAQARLRQQRQLVLIVAVVGLALLAALAAAWSWISGLVQQYLAAVQRGELALAESHRDLEKRVQERTAELSALNRQLRAEMEQRTKMELELRQAQKLEAMGRLAAGLAHEINTPVQFVADSCHYLADGTAQALALLDRYRLALEQVETGAVGASAARAALDAERRRIAADELAVDLPQAGARALEGLERIAQIVRSMKEFSHRGSGQRTPVDLNRAIENTLTIARHEYRYVADVRTEFGDLPPVPCFPGELNQALLNLIVNAAHAIADAVRGSERRGCITVRTRRAAGHVEIDVADDGTGIPDEIRERIFEPFFTTKEIGKGSGQGLAIARAVIVDQHGGQLIVDSTPGQGTTFTIRLPLERPESLETAAP
ncbi:ATP-binding protein [Fontimonas sp. SYSU GA230001]|uniref:sensor histidine kinase n=1 Tax=Fontimonas sp. SYSU GA230001 TaxID=3142450 RepID=UPI0032B54196